MKLSIAGRCRQGKSNDSPWAHGDMGSSSQQLLEIIELDSSIVLDVINSISPPLNNSGTSIHIVKLISNTVGVITLALFIMYAGVPHSTVVTQIM